MEYIITLLILCIVLCICLIIQHSKNKSFKNKVNLNNKHWECYVIMKKWMENRNQNKLLKDYFSKYPYKKIAIYGVGDLGKLFAYELKGSDMNICYFIDRSAEGIRQYENISVITIEDIKEQETVDAIIITPIVDYEAVNQELIRKGITTATVSLRDIIYEV